MPENLPRKERRLLGGAVYRIRAARKVKQDTLAQAAGIHPAYLSNLERSKRQPSTELMRRLADALEVDLDDITYWTVVYADVEAAA